MNPFNAFPSYFLKVNFTSSLEVCKSSRFMHFSLSLFFLTYSHIKESFVTHFKAFECYLSGLVEGRKTRRSDINIISLQRCIGMTSHENTNQSCYHKNKLAESVNDYNKCLATNAIVMIMTFSVVARLLAAKTVYSFPLVSAFRMSTLNDLNSLNRDKTVKPLLVTLFLVYILARVPSATAWPSYQQHRRSRRDRKRNHSKFVRQ